MKEKIKRIKLKYKMKIEGSLVRKIMKLKREIRHLKKELDETRKQNHKLIDQKTLDNIKIRELYLESKK
jgi:hypothetical protein